MNDPEMLGPLHMPGGRMLPVQKVELKARAPALHQSGRSKTWPG
tara:strand:- start:1 stop:132 length:132 start_codon:yes stop_codon:yes gene_type:complete